MAKTFKDRREAKQQASFIGRSEHLDLFRNNLKSDDPIQIFNIFGQGGVGKSCLSQQYKGIAEGNDCITAYSDESIKSVLQWMESVSKQFGGAGNPLPEFDKRYKAYLKEIKQLEADPEKPKGALGDFFKVITKGAIKELKKLPAAELLGSFIDEDSISSSIGDWAEFVRKKITDKDEVELVLEPLKVLTPLFLNDILEFADEYKFVCFFIDTFEETEAILETWLLEILVNDKYGDIPDNILLVIAGRDELNPNLWLPLIGLTQKIPLEPFTEEEANHYLLTHGITDNAVKSDILHLSGRLPVLMAWLVSAAKDSKDNLSGASDTAVDRFLKWITEPDKRDIALASALPRFLNQDIVECLLPDKTQTKPLFEWLINQPFVLRQGDYWVYHNVVRDQMLRYVRTRSRKDWESGHKAIGDYYVSLQNGLELDEGEKTNHPKWLDYEQEYLYHGLCEKPDKKIPEAIHAFVRNLFEKGRNAFHRFGELMQIAGHDNDHIATKGWGLWIITAILDFKKEDASATQTLFENINTKKYINENHLIAYVNLILGYAYSAKGDKDKAIECFQKAIELKPDYPSAFLSMGNAYSAKGDKDKAIESYQKAIALKPDYVDAFYNMGYAYSAKGDKDKAIESYQKAIELKPDYPSAFLSMGNAYSAKGDKDKAIESYQKAIELKPDYVDAFYNMGIVYSAKGDKDKAIESYQKAIDLKPEYVDAFLSMGNAYYAKGDKGKAIESYQKAIDLKPEYVDAFYNMGIVYHDSGDNDKAIECFQKAIDLNPDYLAAFYNMSNAYNDSGDNDKAIECFQKAIDLMPDDAVVFFNMGNAYSAKGDKDKAIVCYQKAIDLNPDDAAVFYYMGNAYYDLGDNGKSIVCYQKAIDLMPEYADIWMRLGWLFLKSGNLQRAHEALLKSVELGSIDFGNMNLGHVYLCQNEISKALECYRICKANFSIKDWFWKYMEDGFHYLEQYGVTKELYQDILKQIREI